MRPKSVSSLGVDCLSPLARPPHTISFILVVNWTRRIMPVVAARCAVTRTGAFFAHVLIPFGILCPFVFDPACNVGGRAVDAAPPHFHAVPFYCFGAWINAPAVWTPEALFFTHDLRPLFTSSYQLRLPVLDECLRITPAAI